MKNISNSEPYPDTINLLGLNVAGSISAGNLVAPTITTDRINFGPYPFTYSTGTWTPTQSTLKIIGLGPACVNVDWNLPRNVTSFGSYVKLGNLVTVYFETSVTFDGLNNDYLSYRTPVIQGLPFRCKTPATQIEMLGVVDADIGEWDGRGFAGTSIPGSVVMDGSFTSKVLETGALFTSRTPPSYVDPITWPSDGRTIFLSCAQTLVGVVGYDWAGMDGNVYNTNVSVLFSNYVSTFKGSLTYFTDE